MTFKLRYFLILVDYIRPLPEVDAALDAHRAFLKSHYDAGHFLMSGARTPRDGGIILAQASDRDEVRTHFINTREMRLPHSAGWQGGQGVNSGAIHNASNAVQRAL